MEKTEELESKSKMEWSNEAKDGGCEMWSWVIESNMKLFGQWEEGDLVNTTKEKWPHGWLRMWFVSWKG